MTLSPDLEDYSNRQGIQCNEKDVSISVAHSTAALIEADDPWNLPELKDTTVPWSRCHQRRESIPLSLGSNIVTTTTAILAAMASPGGTLQNRSVGNNKTLIALVHLLFNISGMMLWFPIPVTRIPIRLAKALGDITARYRWFATVYIISCFFALPLFVFSLSLARWQVLTGVGVPLVVTPLVTAVINELQKRRPGCLPTALRSWDFLPLWAHSLEPWDAVVTAVTTRCCHCCCRTPPDNPVRGSEGGPERQRKETGCELRQPGHWRVDRG